MWTLAISFALAAPGAEALIADAVRAHGLADPSPLAIEFAFRGTPYRLELEGRQSRYIRTVTTDGTTRQDELVGARFRSTVAGTTVSLDPATEGDRRRSLNSVAYFALLPRPLQDDAAIVTALGSTTMRGQPYDTVEVRFQEEGGGDDHDDVFRYWFEPETHRLAFLAYTFSRGNGGVRVRSVAKTHEVGGVVLYDWVNHGRNGPDQSLDAAVADFDAGILPRISSIELEAVTVSR